MLKVGLTGGIGSGKSTVSKMFLEKAVPVIDSDMISREIYKIYSCINEEIKAEFGAEYFDAEGNLKRRELGNFIFKNPERKEKLEAITLPYIVKEIFIRLQQYNDKDEKICVVDAPTLIEVGLYKAMDLNVVVWVDLNTQVERVTQRDNLDIQNVMDRIKSQIPLDIKRSYADFVIDNRGSIEETKEQFEHVLNKIYSYEVKG